MAQFDDTKQEAFLEHLRSGLRRMAAADAVGVAYSTVWRAMERDRDFAQKVSTAEMRADEEIEDALYQAALAGNVTAIQVWLYNRQPGRWRDMRQLAARVHVETEQVVDVDGQEVEEEMPADPDKVIAISRWLREQAALEA